MNHIIVGALYGTAVTVGSGLALGINPFIFGIFGALVGGSIGAAIFHTYRERKNE